MTSTENTAQEAQEPPQEPQETTEAPEPQDDGSKAGKEAARYRRQLRETEAERDQLKERIESMQRAEVERIAGETVTQPAALWAAGTELDNLLDDDGHVDEAKVAEAITAASETLGLARPSRMPRPDPSQGAHGSPVRPDTWTEAMRVG